MIIAGVDMGNSTTEVCLCEIKENGFLFISDVAYMITGLKRAVENVRGVINALELVLAKIHLTVSDIDFIRISYVAPVVRDRTMKTITETIITDSTFVGHNLATLAGQGVEKATLLESMICI